MICIYHSRDLDGWMSAAIVKLWQEEQMRHTQEEESEKTHGSFAAQPPIELLGWDYGQPIPSLNPERESDIVMVDVSFPSKTMDALNELFNLTWIDHHISAIKEVSMLEPLPFIKGMRNDKFAACELTWKHFFSDRTMPEIVRLLGRYDCFGHKGTDEEQKVLEFQYAARSYWKSVSDCYEALKQDDARIIGLFSELGKGIYKYLCTEAEQAYANRFTIELDGYFFACVNKERFNPINFGINYHNDKATDNHWYDGFACFWYANGKYNYSLYNDNGQVDCSIIAKNRGGGGHKGASGFIASEIISK